MPCDDRRENPYAACTVLEAVDGSSYHLASWRRSGGCTIVEMDGYLGIFGDLCPLDNRGVWSEPGYSLDWFVDATDEKHVASKFLLNGWQPDLAERELRRVLAQILASGTAGKVAAPSVRTLIQDRVWNRSENSFLEALIQAGFDIHDQPPGYGFRTQDMVLLAGLRAKIAAYRLAKTQAPVPRTPPAPAHARRSINIGQHMRPGLRRPQ